MASSADVSAQLKELAKIINENHKAVNARLDAIEKNSSKGSSLGSVVIVAVIAVIIATALQNPQISDPVKSAIDRTLILLKLVDEVICHPLTIYRYGNLKNYSGPLTKQCTIGSDVVMAAANKLFPSPDNNISRLLSMTGRDLPYDLILREEPLTVIALSSPDREHFMWPIVRVGHTVTVEVGEEKHQVTVKTLSPEPRVFELHDLLSSEECDNFADLAKLVQDEMSESMVGADHATSTKSKARSSRHTWLGSVFADGGGQWKTNEVIERVEKRIFDLVRLTKDTAEPFQVVFYNESDYYYGHHDYTDPIHAPNNPYFRGGGNRFVTVLLYLNDVEEGGYTAFPFADPNGKPHLRHLEPTSLYQGSSACEAEGLKVHPRKGGAAMFYNLQENGHMDGKFDKWTVHAGCKPTKGTKYISNKWIRNKRVGGHLYDDVW